MRALASCILVCLCLSTFAQEPLRVGIIKFKSEEKVKETFTPLFQYVADKMGRTLELEIVKDDDLGFHLINHDYDIGLFTVFPYLKTKSDFPELHVFATHTVNNQDFYNGSILVKKTSGIVDLHHLENGQFLFVKPTSTSGFKYPKGIFNENDLDVDDDFFTYDFTYDHNASLDSLINETVDGIAINQSYFESRDDIDKNDYIELANYKVPYHAYVLSPEVTKPEEEQIHKILFNAHKDPKAKKIFKNPLNVTSVIPEDDNYYNIIRRYLRITRVKPALNLDIHPWGKAKEELSGDSDLLQLMTSKIRLGLQSSGRFSTDEYTNQKFFEKVTMNLYQVGKEVYHYQVLLNDILIDEGEDIPVGELVGYLPRKIKDDILRNIPIRGNLYFNGKDWFLTYGKHDGINLEDYEFVFNPETASSFILKGSDVSKLTEVNTHFANDPKFKKEMPVLVNYRPEKEVTIELDDPTAVDTYNIFSAAFWKTNYWDKLGIMFAVIGALISGIVGRYIQSKKKARFKDLLYRTNELIKEYVNGHYEMEAKIIEQKEYISALLDKGTINENQFLILKNRIADVQNLMDGVEPHEIKLTEDQKNEIEEIVRDNKITEKEFLQIMNILKKRP
ncbi:MAG: PhnD/SsuA/transferrin family substrate-binding protein [bacterium]|nr:PhnD/SsuA/transferrin family substrate-binding protein [bacterium]